MLIPYLLLPLLGIAFASVYRVRYYRATPPLRNPFFWLLMGGWAITTILVTVHNFSQAFGPGVLMPPLIVVAAATGTLILLLPFRQGRLPLLHVALVGAALIAPLAGLAGYAGTCNTLNYRAGDSIAAALNAYQDTEGDYPARLDALLPDYMAAIPSVRCFAPFQPTRPPGRTADYWLIDCGDRVLLSTSTLLGVGDSVRPLDEATWRAPSFLDGACSGWPPLSAPTTP